MRNFLMLLAALMALAIGGLFLSRAKTIDLGWQTSRMTPEYRRTVREAARAATENGAIHSLDSKRNLMRIEVRNWEKQSAEMRLSLLRLASRYFDLKGYGRQVEVRAAYSNRKLAKFDGGNQFMFTDGSEANPNKLAADFSDETDR